ncbi:MAG: transposase [Anaerolineae bacterium]|nr:transposase [Anaerolineae bacterium]
MKPYSLDLRERVVAALDEGELTQPEIADKYDISLRTVETWARQWRETGTIEPKPHRRGPLRTLQAVDLHCKMYQVYSAKLHHAALTQNAPRVLAQTTPGVLG